MTVEEAESDDVVVAVVDGITTLACIVISVAPGHILEVRTTAHNFSKAGMVELLRKIADDWEQETAIKAIHG
jgi:hypothetical protein